MRYNAAVATYDSDWTASGHETLIIVKDVDFGVDKHSSSGKGDLAGRLSCDFDQLIRRE